MKFFHPSRDLLFLFQIFILASFPQITFLVSVRYECLEPRKAMGKNVFACNKHEIIPVLYSEYDYILFLRQCGISTHIGAKISNKLY
jgi:hypothetical protein